MIVIYFDFGISLSIYLIFIDIIGIKSYWKAPYYGVWRFNYFWRGRYFRRKSEDLSNALSAGHLMPARLMISFRFCVDEVILRLYKILDFTFYHSS